ncbi:hypothetical protein EB001_14500 [bacterium]|nr:hypothetical protein [bacterium]
MEKTKVVEFNRDQLKLACDMLGRILQSSNKGVIKYFKLEEKEPRRELNNLYFKLLYIKNGKRQYRENLYRMTGDTGYLSEDVWVDKQGNFI